MTATVALSCGHSIDVDHSMGERLTACTTCGIEHVVTAVHTNAVTYTARRRTPQPEPETEEVDA